MRGGVERVILMVSGDNGTGHRRVTWSIFELGLVVHRRFIYISTGDYAGLQRGEGKEYARGGTMKPWSG